MNEEVKKPLTSGPVILFRGARKLSSYLVRAKLYPLERSVGSFKCNGNNWQVWIWMYQKVISSLTQLAKKTMLLVIVFTAMNNALHTFSLVISANYSMQVRLSMTFVFEAIITKIIIGNTLEKKHACINIFLNTS